MNKHPKYPPHLILLCGGGGVGKTSLAASFAILGACKGFNSLAFTVDPARRLADTLGLSLASEEVHNISISHPDCSYKGRLEASMLDLDKAILDLVKRYAPDDKITERIKSNRIFQTAIDHLIGSEEYIALGKVFQIFNDHPMDLMFVDTAPTKYALDFFKGPEKLLKILNPDVLQKIMAPVLRFSISGAISPQTHLTSIINQIIQALIGIPIVKEMADLASALNVMFSDFRHRVEEMHSILRDPERTSILIVTTPQWGAIEEAKSISHILIQSNLALKGIIINQVSPDFPVEKTISKLKSIQRAKITSPKNRKQLNEIVEKLRDYSSNLKQETNVLKRLKRSLPQQLLVESIPLMMKEFCTMEELHHFHPYLEIFLDRITRNRLKKSKPETDEGKKEYES